MRVQEHFNRCRRHTFLEKLRSYLSGNCRRKRTEASRTDQRADLAEAGNARSARLRYRRCEPDEEHRRREVDHALLQQGNNGKGQEKCRAENSFRPGRAHFWQADKRQRDRGASQPLRILRLRRALDPHAHRFLRFNRQTTHRIHRNCCQGLVLEGHLHIRTGRERDRRTGETARCQRAVREGAGHRRQAYQEAGRDVCGVELMGIQCRYGRSCR